jgi:Domain of unknown function (DUF1707)
MAAGPEMRVGHAEREAVAAELREHYASGRLTLEELNERLDKAFAAKTRSDLDALMTDLPSVRPFSATGTGGQQYAAGPSAAGGRGTGAGWQAGQAIAAMAWAAFMVCAMLTVGFLGVFGIGVGKPFGIVLVLAGLAFLRRLIFRRHHHHRARGPHRRHW